ncbi:MAG: hypothetical protein H6945_19070 [Zoogloeaceae bacterium]|nr:hypothetical protein [Rhodocyclaceae bacterium]MCP5237838.1 hypothetical protein [Zoogloeaceae bacterium]
MNTPKSLPWYARKAGVPIERAEALWRQAVRHATADTGWVGNSEYWGATMDRFRQLLSQERATLCTPQVLPFLRSHKRIMRVPIEVINDVAVLTMRHWHHYLTQARRAA